MTEHVKRNQQRRPQQRRQNQHSQSNHRPSQRHHNGNSGQHGHGHSNPRQAYAQYMTKAKDAFASGDRVLGESLMQHAEHFYRVAGSLEPPKVPTINKQEPVPAKSAEAVVESVPASVVPESKPKTKPKPVAAESSPPTPTPV